MFDPDPAPEKYSSAPNGKPRPIDPDKVDWCAGQPPLPGTTTEAKLGHLSTYRELLTTLGGLTSEARIQASSRQSPDILSLHVDGHGTLRERYEASVERSAELEHEAHSLVGDLLGVSTLAAAGILSEEEAAARVDTTYDMYAGQYIGLDPEITQARKRELAQVDRQIEALQAEQANPQTNLFDAA